MNFFRAISNVFHFNRTNWKAVSLCFVAATVFWFFNALNKDYSTNLRFKVNFEFDRDRYIPVDPLPAAVFMNVSGNGWDLLRKSLGFNLPDMNIQLDRPTEVKKIVGSTLPALLAGQLGNLQINHVVTDTLYLSLDPKETKKVKVVVDPSRFSFETGFGRLSPIVVLPDSIELNGPRSIVNKMADSLVLDIEESGITNNFREEVEVKLADIDRIKRNPATVEVIFEVVEWIEVNKKVRLEVQNLPKGIRLNLVKDSITCTVQIPKGQADDFIAAHEQELAILDLGELKKGDAKVRPKVTGLPKNARLLSIDSVAIRLY